MALLAGPLGCALLAGTNRQQAPEWQYGTKPKPRGREKHAPPGSRSALGTMAIGKDVAAANRSGTTHDEYFSRARKLRCPPLGQPFQYRSAKISF